MKSRFADNLFQPELKLWGYKEDGHRGNFDAHIGGSFLLWKFKGNQRAFEVLKSFDGY